MCRCACLMREAGSTLAADIWLGEVKVGGVGLFVAVACSLWRGVWVFGRAAKQQRHNKALHPTAYSFVPFARSSLRSLRFRRRVSLVVVPSRAAYRVLEVLKCRKIRIERQTEWLLYFPGYFQYLYLRCGVFGLWLVQHKFKRRTSGAAHRKTHVEASAFFPVFRYFLFYSGR